MSDQAKRAHHDDHHEHGHGNHRDQGLKAMWRYITIAPRMWSSEVNDAVVDLVAPKHDETVVDIGAGMGPAAMRAARLGASVVAVEPTRFMRNVVSARRLLSRHRKLINIVDGGAEALPVPDDSADAVWAVNTMHHWVDPGQAANEIARIVKRTGRVWLVDENFADAEHPDHAAWTERHSDTDHHGFSMVDADEIGQLLHDAGLARVIAGGREIAGRPTIAVTVGASIP